MNTIMPLADNTQNEEPTKTAFSLSEIKRDFFLDGGFVALQPKDRGNRSGMDALLLSASLPDDLSGTLADLGAGAGVAGFAALHRNEHLKLLAVERDEAMVKLARQSLNLPENAHFAPRVSIIEADVTLTGKERRNAGLEADSVDHLIMNPPYNGKGNRAPKDPMRTDAFMMAEGGLDAWFRTAAAMVKPGGSMTIIYRIESLGDVIACSQGRFGKLEIIPVHSRANDPAKRMIVRGICGSFAPMTILPGFVVHGDGEQFSPEAEAIFRGQAGLGY